MWRPAVFALFTFTLTACVSTSAVYLNPSAQKYPPVAPDFVQVFTSRDKVTGDYEEVAILYAKGDVDWTNEEGLIKALRKKAGKMGCDGIILSEIQDPSTGAKVWKALLGTSANRKTQVIGIRLRKSETP